MADLTQDAFLGGRARAWQPARGYRAGTDAVFLAAACPARPGDSVLELGCGAGVAALCLAARVPGLALTGVERQPHYAALARRNFTEAGLVFELCEADLADLPPALRARSFGHVIANPPFFDPARGSPAPEAGRAGARHGDTPLTAWVAAARARLSPKGWLTAITAAEQVPALLSALEPGFGSISVLPLAAREGREAGRVLVRARKGGRGAFRLAAPLILHDGPAHAGDGDDYTAAATAILRDGAAIDWP